MGHTMQNVGLKLKNTSSGLFTFAVRVVSGGILGLTLSLIGQEVFAYGTFSFLFVLFVGLGLFLRWSRRWSLARVLVFDLICVLVGLLLRMYVLVAPGA